MTIDSFEKGIEQKIIDRGFHYYENDYIEGFESLGNKEFSATVVGSEEYSVFIKLGYKNTIIEHSCDCPYDWGNYCKHEVAVLYYIRDGEAYNDIAIFGNRIILIVLYYIRDGEAYNDEPSLSGTIHKIQKELSQYSKAELENLVLGLAKRDGKLRKKILWELGLRG